MTPATDAAREARARQMLYALTKPEECFTTVNGQWLSREAAIRAMLAFADTEAASQPREGDARAAAQRLREGMAVVEKMGGFGHNTHLSERDWQDLATVLAALTQRPPEQAGAADYDDRPAQLDHLTALINQGVWCEAEDAFVPLVVVDDSDASVGMHGGVSLYLSAGYEITKVALAVPVGRLSEDDVRAMLRADMSRVGGLRAWARLKDIPKSRVSEFETGRRLASLPILVALGLTRAIVPLSAAPTPPDAGPGEVPDGMVAWNMVSRLRDEEADSVTILCDNPDGPPNNAVECCGFWTGFVDRRFEGGTINDALASAVAAKDHAASIGYPDPAPPETPPGAGPREAKGNQFRPMDTWDNRDEAVLLLVDYENGEHPLDDARFAITIGHNNDHNVNDDEGQGWRFTGWCWSHDHYVEGRGKPVGWMPVPHILARSYAAFDGAPPQTPLDAGIGSDGAGDLV